MGCSRFARHYSGNRCFFLFLRLLRCFSSPAYLRPPYVFRRWYPRITTGGFPHSEILGSTLDQQLPEAYRSRPRPSSAPGAKASTVCSLFLDCVENTTNRYGVFKVRAEDRFRRPERRQAARRRPEPVSQNSTVQVVGVDVFQASPVVRTAEGPSRPGRPRRLVPPHSLERR